MYIYFAYDRNKIGQLAKLKDSREYREQRNVRTDLTSDADTLSTSVTRSDDLYTRPLRSACCPRFSNNAALSSAAYNISAFNAALPRAISASDSFGDLR